MCNISLGIADPKNKDVERIINESTILLSSDVDDIKTPLTVCTCL